MLHVFNDSVLPHYISFSALSKIPTAHVCFLLQRNRPLYNSFQLQNEKRLTLFEIGWTLKVTEVSEISLCSTIITRTSKQILIVCTGTRTERGQFTVRVTRGKHIHCPELTIDQSPVNRWPWLAACEKQGCRSTVAHAKISPRRCGSLENKSLRDSRSSASSGLPLCPYRQASERDT